MMRMFNNKYNEAKFGRLLKQNCPEVQFWRMENKADSGTPDLHYMVEGGATGWLELKVADSFGQKLKIRPAQVNWIHDYALIGGVVLIAVWVNSEDLLIFDGIKARELCRKKIWEVESIMKSGHSDAFDGVTECLQHMAYGSPGGAAAFTSLHRKALWRNRS